MENNMASNENLGWPAKKFRRPDNKKSRKLCKLARFSIFIFFANFFVSSGRQLKKSPENFVNWLTSLFLYFLLIILSACADNRRKTRKLCKLTYSLPLPFYCLWHSLFLHFHPFFVFPRWSALHPGIFSRLFLRIAPSG